MYITPINVELKPGTAFAVLDKNEVLKSDDLIRETVYVTDYISTDAEMNMNWQKVQDRLPAWVGKTILDYESFGSTKSTYEVIRIIKIGKKNE